MSLRAENTATHLIFTSSLIAVCIGGFYLQQYGSNLILDTIGHTSRFNALATGGIQALITIPIALYFIIKEQSLGTGLIIGSLSHMAVAALASLIGYILAYGMTPV